MGTRRPANSTIARYLRLLAANLGLADWRIEVDDTTPADEGHPNADATIGVNREKSYASVSVSPDLFRLPPDEQRRQLVHELVHVHLAPLGWSFEDATARMGKQAKGLADATWTQREERATDDLAGLLAPGLPLPPWCR